MKKPLVAIVGKPNTGKSTFFNKVAGSKISIVEDIPGVTRDRIFANAEWCGYQFQIVDTGGLDFGSNDEINARIIEQANLAIDLADVIILFVDGRAGCTSQDVEIANHLRRTKAPKVLAVNKLDNNEVEKTYDFYELGLGEPIAVSAELSKGIGDVLDAVVKDFKRIEEDVKTEEIKIALIGKPNVGKSSITNKLLGEDRVVVSPVAGTTRDAIDSEFQNEFGKYVFIDTAGIRRKSKVKENIEKYSVMRSNFAIERADVCIMMIDSTEGVSEQDSKVIGEAHEAGKGIIIVVNKWDEIEKENGTLEKFKKEVYNSLSYASYAPILFISAKTGQRVNKLFEMINEVNKYYKFIESNNLRPKYYSIVLINKEDITKSLEIENLTSELIINNIEEIVDSIINKDKKVIDKYNINYKYID